MRAGLTVVVWCGTALALATNLSAQQAFFTEGNRLYQAEDYAGAIQVYERILEDGYESGVVYYNLGNAYFKLGRLGPAILNYERARRLMPRDGDLRANLELARSVTTDDITPLPTFLPFAVVRWWVQLFPLATLRLIVAVGYLVGIVGVTVMVLRRGAPEAVWAGRGAAVAGGVAVILGVNLLVREVGIGVPDEAVVLSESVSVQSAPSDDADLQLFTIHEGTKVRLDQIGDEWVEVVLEDGRVGWVRAEAVERI